MIENVGERLRLARERRRLTQDAAANHVGIARTTLVAIESGARQAKPMELAGLAKLYKMSVNRLVRGSAIALDFKGEFRRGKEVIDDDDAALEALRVLTGLASACVELEERLGQQVRHQYPQETRLLRTRLEEQAEDLAVDVRSRLGLGVAPIQDLVTVLECEMGVRIFFYPLPSDIAGVYGYHERSGACVVVNSKHPDGRQRWTLAHELCHLLTNRASASVLWLSKRDPAEYFADLFAGAFLAPGLSVRKAFSEYSQGTGFSIKHLVLLAHRYGLSIEAMSRRLERLGLWKTGTYDALRERGLSASVVEQVLGASGPKQLVRPPRLMLLAAIAHERGLYTEQQISELLALPLLKTREILDAFGDGEGGANEVVPP